MNTTSQVSSEMYTKHIQIGNHSDQDYSNYITHMQNHLASCLRDGEKLLFHTDAGNLWDVYLNGFAPEDRQYHNCNACRHFIERYGDLVYITSDNRIKSAVWNIYGLPYDIKFSIQSMINRVEGSKIKGIFLSDKTDLGISDDPVWKHYNLTLPKYFCTSTTVHTVHEQEALKLEEFKMLKEAISSYTPMVARDACRLLSADVLYRANKVIEHATWFSTIAKEYKGRDEFLWKTVAKAPAGFAHIKSTMLGSLMDDIMQGTYSISEIKSRFNAKMNPTKYQRPQAAPSAGNVKAAESLVAKMGLEKSFGRRSARIGEIETVWKPSKVKVKKTNVKANTPSLFAGIKTKDTVKYGSTSSFSLPPITMTWERFSREVLKKSSNIEIFLPYERTAFGSITTATNADAPPILKWDNEKIRNPFAWYLYSNGSYPSKWNLLNRRWSTIKAISKLPCMWFLKPDERPHEEGIIFIIDKARDMNTALVSACLFPEMIRSELHGIRSTIEAYSKNTAMSGVKFATACGLFLFKNRMPSNPIHLRVTTELGVQEFKIDRLI